MDAMAVRGKEAVWFGDFELCSDLKPCSLDRSWQRRRRNDTKMQMRSFASGRRVRKKIKGYELRELHLPYKALFDTEKSFIEDGNQYFWN
jgi:hypothetical protein